MTDDDLSALLAYVAAENRVCPEPPEWNELWLLLPDRRRHDEGWLPAAPLILAGWWASDDNQKAERLAYHIRWAYERGALPLVDHYIRQLSPERWRYR